MKVEVEVEGFHYPPLAIGVKIQGDLTFEVSGSARKLVSGHPLLAQPAEANLATWTLPSPRDEKYIVNYRFRPIIPAGTKQETILVGDKLDRLFLRVLRVPTTKIVTHCYNDPATEPATRYALHELGALHTIDVYVTGRAWCVPEPFY